jgi:hypothetical protein
MTLAPWSSKMVSVMSPHVGIDIEFAPAFWPRTFESWKDQRSRSTKNNPGTANDSNNSRVAPVCVLRWILRLLGLLKRLKQVGHTCFRPSASILFIRRPASIDVEDFPTGQSSSS